MPQNPAPPRQASGPPLDPDRIIKVPVQDYIRIRGARVHNLKNISLSIPHNQLTVVTGVSGSGKSSLAFDTIYAEGQRRYVESLSAYARQFLERMEKPDVDEIDGIAPAVAIRQKNTTRNPRSTVATSTECYDFLRLLFARVGQTYCPNCGTRVRKDTVDQVAARMLDAARRARAGTRCFPCGEHADTQALRDHLFELRKKGFNRLFQDGRTVRVLHAGVAARHRFRASRSSSWWTASPSAPDLHQRLVDTIEICYREAGEVIFESAAGDGDRCASTRSSSARRAAWSSPSRSRSCSASTRPFGRVPALPGLRQHHRLRHGPRDPRPVAVARRGRRGSVDQAASTAPGCDNFKKHATGQVRFERAVLRSDRGRARDCSTTSSARFFDAPGEQEVQDARARFPEPLPRLCALPGVPGRAACARKRSTCASAARTWPKSCA